ncbi:hypothetical protein BN946_scf185014.g91 [Trametes cinnabarina]|uniref:tRNA(Ile)-lysidine synthetase n=1 Tax=Pycnoporus cinnabarinus TaxID=5643 RepID=A0A060SHD5_PYCCI|nr:hypothetical protein BN946_scf185014.g91 [Trametes cinnabarina]
MPPSIIPPITPAEFFQYLQRCIPPTGWSSKIVVANSGGPDSTALLFLLNAVIAGRNAIPKPNTRPRRRGAPTPPPSLPEQLVSVHVNHSLQAAATDMERVATAMALRYKLSFHTERIPWGEHPFPARDAVDEKVAREARYSRLFNAMGRVQSDVIAFAHHADDQVETAIMRMSQGSSARGLAAMRPVRRWGMGKKDNEYFAFGADGMRRWIVRPLLHVSKDRLMATCEANKLDYIHDPTNFQPDLTFRNQVRRHLLLADESSPPASQQLSRDIEPFISRMRAEVRHVHPPEQLREAVRLYGIRLEEVDSQVTNILAHSRMPSPPSTLLLKSHELAEATEEEVRIALIRRCLRYVSHGPWGAVWAEANGGRDTLRRVSEELWPSTPRTPLLEMPIDPITETHVDPRKTFAAGAGVLVTPVVIKLKKGEVRYRGRKLDDEDEVEGWIFSRSPPYHKSPSHPGDKTVVDVTNGIKAARAAGQETYRVLYDYRFDMAFKATANLPKDVEEHIFVRNGRIVIEPDTKWVLPSIMMRGGYMSNRCIGKYLWDLPGWKDSRRRPVKYQSIVNMKFIRSLDAI